VLGRHAAARDVHERVAARMVAEGLEPVLDVGCGEGELARYLPADAWVGLDSSPRLLAAAPAGAVEGDATALPFADGTLGSVALLYVLYHVDDPRLALAEAWRVLRPGGLVAVAAPSRHDSPELAVALPERMLTFDAELAPELLAERFGAIGVERWDAPLVSLPTRDDVRDYLVGKGVARDAAAAEAASVAVPLTVTKRGALVFGRRRDAPGPAQP
jgi:SAM-dependent methyltransferase